jgi:hypothetical protein
VIRDMVIQCYHFIKLKRTRTGTKMKGIVFLNLGLNLNLSYRKDWK